MVGVLNDLLEPYGPNPDNVFVDLAYTENTDGSVNDFSLVVDNNSTENVFVVNAVFEVEWWMWEFVDIPWWDQRPGYTPACRAECGTFFVYPTTGDYLGTVEAATTSEIGIYNNAITYGIHPMQNSSLSGRSRISVFSDMAASNSISPIYVHAISGAIPSQRGKYHAKNW